MSKYIHVYCPAEYSLRNIDTSIGRRAISFARECSYLEVSRVIAGPAQDVRRIYGKRIATKVLVDYRPGDIILRSEVIGEFNALILLVHQQDTEEFTEEQWQQLNNIIKKNNAVVSATTRFGKDFLISKGININYNIIRIPLRGYSPVINSRSIATWHERAEYPSITLWLSPAVRKNSYFGTVAVLDAIKKYGHTVQLNVISRYYNVNVEQLAKYFEVNNANITIYVDPSDEDIDNIISRSHTVVLPSYDEGLNLPLYESARYGMDVIVPGISPHIEAPFMFSNIKLTEVEKRKVFGHKNDEMQSIFNVYFPIYQDLIDVITNSLQSWNISRNRVKSTFEENRHLVQPWRSNISSLSSFLKISKRTSSGKAVIEVL